MNRFFRWQTFLVVITALVWVPVSHSYAPAASMLPLEVWIDGPPQVANGQTAVFKIHVQNLSRTAINGARVEVPWWMRFSHGTTHLKPPNKGPKVGSYKEIRRLEPGRQTTFMVVAVVDALQGVFCMEIRVTVPGRSGFKLDRLCPPWAESP